jgi:GNAT superfamily N-acetyltransferase
MLVRVKNNRQARLRLLTRADLGLLENYLSGLGPDTRRRFGPHAFDPWSLEQLYQPGTDVSGFIGTDPFDGSIVAYAVVKKGLLGHDADRLRTYGIFPDSQADCTFAPSVADAWQGSGLGGALFSFVLEHLTRQGVKRVVLWGGVQQDNVPARRFYQRWGFRKLGEFEYYGMNDDMVLELDIS